MNGNDHRIEIGPDTKNCKNCEHFDERTMFCRAHPPIPMIVSTQDGDVLTSKFPKIEKPALDYCDSDFDRRILSE